jgi:hypothetical protein
MWRTRKTLPLPNSAKKAKLDSSWLPEWAFVDKHTVPIHPGTNAAERMWWERYAVRKGLYYHHEVVVWTETNLRPR